MRVEGIANLNIASISKRNELKRNDNVYNQIKDLTNLSASSFGIVFKGKNVTRLSEEDCELEKYIVSKMRSIGVNTPEIKDNSYILQGKTANPDTNPITQKHIKNILNNIMIMDKAGIAHGDIEKGHTFYCQDGNVELDCFRFNWSFDDKDRRNWEFPEFCYPTNLKQFEGNCLGDYIKQIGSPDMQNEFLKMYLKESSIFHNKKAEFLEKTQDATQEQIKYEKLQAKVFENPDDDTVELFKDKINLMYQSRLAFTEWDEGNGACGHEIDDSRTTDAVKMYFSIISDISKHIEKVEESQSSSSDEKLQYLDYEKRYAQDMLKKTIDSTLGMANWTVNPDNPNNLSYKDVPTDERKQFKKMCDSVNSDKETLAQVEEMYLKILGKLRY